jgi:lauroyl/myristoyl acyltransferase
MHGVIFDLIYSRAAQALSLVPPPVIERLCGWESSIPWPKQHRLVPQVAGRLGCTPADARAILAQARANDHCAHIDALRWSRGPRRDDVHVRLVEIRHLHQAAAEQRGVILALPHTSALYVALWPAQRLVADLGYSVHAFAWEAPPERAMATNVLGYIDPAQRRMYGALAILAALRAGDIVATGVDYPSNADQVRAPDRRWLIRRFLGRRFGFSPGIGALARRARAPILPAVPLRTGPAQYSLRFLPALNPPKTARQELAVMDQLLDMLEAVIRAQPGQYLPWFYTLPPL